MNTLPADFVGSEYLELHPDVKSAGVDPAQHYLTHGIQEGRRYKHSSPTLPPVPGDPYDRDGLRSMHNHDFMVAPRFLSAYERGKAAVGSDYRWYWRVHIALWAAASAARLRASSR